LYSPQYYERAKAWFEEAKTAALERIAKWKVEDYKNSLNGA
jgi:hypothetical protein